MKNTKTLGMKWAVIISVLNVVISTIIWYFGQERSARVDLSSDSTFFAIAMAAGRFHAAGHESVPAGRTI